MKRILLIAALILCTPQSLANSEQSVYGQILTDLNKMLNQKDWEGAFQFSEQHAYEYGGLPEFDLLTGFAAFGSERYQEAVFAFERVAVERPNSFLARFYLALVYQKVNNLPAATTELNKLLKRPLQADQKEKAQSLLERIERQVVNKKLKWSHAITTGVSMDSNVNSGTSLDTYQFAIIDEPFTLSDSSKKTNDLSYNLFYRATYQHPFTQNQWVRGSINLGHINYLQHTEYRKTPIFASLAYEYNTKYGLLNTSVSTAPIIIADGLFRTDNTLSVALSKTTSRTTSYNTSFGYTLIDNAIDESLNMDRIKASYAFTLKGSVIQTVMGHVYQETNSGNGAAATVANDKDVFGAMYQVTLPITEHILGNSFILYEKHSYHEINFLDQKTRADDIIALSGQLMFNTSNELKLKLFVNHHIKNSNIGLFEYNRTEIGATWQIEL